MDSRATELRFAALLALGLAAVFINWPQVDLAAAGLFAQNDWHWLFARDSLLVDIPYYGMPWFGKALIGTLALLWGASFLPRFYKLRSRRLLFGFLLAGALLGPVLIVDAGLKSHLGRARPAQTTVFGGALEFTPAFVKSDQCERNCSFVSGHVATTAFIMAFGWLGSTRTRRRWLVASLVLAGYMSLVRMSAGSHFLSDCLFAWFATYFSLWLTEWAYHQRAWLGRARVSYRLTIGAFREIAIARG